MTPTHPTTGTPPAPTPPDLRVDGIEITRENAVTFCENWRSTCEEIRASGKRVEMGEREIRFIEIMGIHLRAALATPHPEAIAGLPPYTQEELETFLSEWRKFKADRAVLGDLLAKTLIAFEDLSFECFSFDRTAAPSRETYNRTFKVLDEIRQRLGIKVAREFETLPEDTGDARLTGLPGLAEGVTRLLAGKMGNHPVRGEGKRIIGWIVDEDVFQYLHEGLNALEAIRDRLALPRPAGEGAKLPEPAAWGYQSTWHRGLHEWNETCFASCCTRLAALPPALTHPDSSYPQPAGKEGEG